MDRIARFFRRRWQSATLLTVVLWIIWELVKDAVFGRINEFLGDAAVKVMDTNPFWIEAVPLVILAIIAFIIIWVTFALARRGQQQPQPAIPAPAPAAAAPIALSPLFFAVATDGRQPILTPDKWKTVQFHTAVVDPGRHFDIQDSRFTSGGGSYHFEIGLDLDEADKNAESYDLLLETSNGRHRRKYGPHDHLIIDTVVNMDIADSATVKIRQNGGVAMTTIKSGGQWRCQLVGY